MSSPPIFPPEGPVELDHRRRELRAWLSRNAPSLAELYQAALIQLRDRPPGYFRLVAHAVREIGNGLPQWVAGVERPGRLDHTSRLDAIIVIWQKSGLLQDTFGEAELPDAHVAFSIPGDAARAVIQLLNDHLAARLRPAEFAQRLFTGAAPENAEFESALEPVLKQWVSTIRWFVGNAHDNGRCDHESDHDELVRRFDLFEKGLMAVVRGFYSTIEELDAILEDTNS
jgi:hypothetical protein